MSQFFGKIEQELIILFLYYFAFGLTKFLQDGTIKNTEKICFYESLNFL